MRGLVEVPKIQCIFLNLMNVSQFCMLSTNLKLNHNQEVFGNQYKIDTTTETIQRILKQNPPASGFGNVLMNLAKALL